MKKQLFPILTLALGVLGLASCQKDVVDNTVASTPMVSVIATISSEVDSDVAGSRTAYDPTLNQVLLKAGETISISAASPGDKMWTAATDENGATPILLKKNASGGFEVSFKHIAVPDATSYDYFFVHPAEVGGIAGEYTVSGHLLPQAQFPTEDGVTFDPQADILIGGMQTVVTNDPTVAASMNVRFKRLFVPFKVTISDVDGLLNGEDIKSVLFAAPGADDWLTGEFEVSHASTADGISHNMYGNSDGYEGYRDVMASYPTKLAANADGTYTVWYIVNPTTLRGNVTVTVTTPTRTLTCLVTPADSEIAVGKINKVDLKIQNSNTTITNKSSDLEAVYDAGADFYIGNVKINRTLYPNKLTLADGATMSENVDGIYFLESGTYTLPKTAKNLVVVGKDGQQVVVNNFNDGARLYTQLNGSFISKNIKLVGQRGDNYNINNGSAKMDVILNDFILDSCRIEIPTSTTGSGSLATFGNPYKNVVVRKCMITLQTTADMAANRSVSFISFGGILNGAELANVEMVDNVFYSAFAARGTIFQTNMSASGIVSNSLTVKFMRNSLIRYFGSNTPHISVHSVKEVVFRNNLIWLDSNEINCYVLRIKNSSDIYIGYNPILTFSKNGSVGQFLPTVSLDKVWSTVTAPTQSNEDKLTADPFVGQGGVFDPATMTFIPADAYKQYGARTW